jgi:glycosyltransferase involved in cell wall biosynthesis
MGISSSKIKYIPLGVYSNLDKGYGESTTDIVYMYFGWLSPIRGFTDLLKAFDVVNTRNERTRLLIANPGGHSEEMAMLKMINRCSKRNAIDVISWQENIHDLLKNADVVVLPFRGNYGYSQPPLVVVESLNAYRPVIATTIGSISEYVIHERNGLLVKKNNLKALINAMISMGDKTKCSQMGRMAYSEIQKYNWNNVINRYIEYYNDLY